MKVPILVVLLAAACPIGAYAQVEEIVVTAMSRSDYDGMPAITIKKPADFLLQEIKLVDDSRSPDLRKKEIIETISSMLRAAATDKRIALSHGEGFLEPVHLDHNSLQIIEDKKRADTSPIDSFLTWLL